MKEIILLKDGEIVLKGLNRRTFEDVLKKNIRHAISHLGSFEIKSAQSIIYVKPLSDDIDLDEACLKISRVSVSLVYLYVPLISVSSPKAISEKTDRQTASARKGQRILINLFFTNFSPYTYYI